MQYTSTRDNSLSVSASQAIAGGISNEGGLFVPERIPAVPRGWLEPFGAMAYPARARFILSHYLTDYTTDELEGACAAAYGDAFENKTPAPLTPLSDGRWMLELWHGPTCAFKDMALQLLPRLMGPAAARALDGRQILILAATSGDTGKAALEGFKDVPGVRIAVFFPDRGVSAMQRLQMVTQQGENVAVYAIEGNFDDAQTGVKQIFADRAVIDRLAQENTVLSSANSINWGRLAPQIVYYFSAYADLIAQGGAAPGDPVNFVVPTGNFGNILAGYYAARMGLPVNRLICASNRNNVLTDFLRRGVYDANRAFFATLSPSMDILISSNLERLLFELAGRDDRQVCRLMEALREERRYEIGAPMRSALQELFWGGCLDDEGCRRQIAQTFFRDGCAADPHTAVALGVCEQYRRETNDMTPAVILSTASPYKFAPAVLAALGDPPPDDEFEALRGLAARTGTRPPAGILRLESAPVRFRGVISPGEMPRNIVSFASGKAL